MRSTAFRNISAGAESTPSIQSERKLCGTFKRVASSSVPPTTCAARLSVLAYRFGTGTAPGDLLPSFRSAKASALRPSSTMILRRPVVNALATRRRHATTAYLDRLFLAGEATLWTARTSARRKGVAASRVERTTGCRSRVINPRGRALPKRRGDAEQSLHSGTGHRRARTTPAAQVNGLASPRGTSALIYQVRRPISGIALPA